MWLRIASRYPVGLIQEPYLKKYGGHEDQLSRKYEAMDRFRVKALAETIQSGILTPKQKNAAQTMLDEKLKILELGARKRNNTELLLEIGTLGKRDTRNVSLNPFPISQGKA